MGWLTPVAKTFQQVETPPAGASKFGSAFVGTPATSATLAKILRMDRVLTRLGRYPLFQRAGVLRESIGTQQLPIELHITMRTDPNPDNPQPL